MQVGRSRRDPPPRARRGTRRERGRAHTSQAFIWALGAQPLNDFMLLTFALFMALLVLIVLYVYKARLIEAVTE